MDYEEELTEFFRQYDVMSKWGMTPEEATEAVFAGEPSHLRSHTIEDFINGALSGLHAQSSAAYTKQWEWDHDAIAAAVRASVMKSPYASMHPKYQDLTHRKSITLSDGTVIPINQQKK